MSERTTKELVTPSGHKVVIKEYLTAREMLPILKSTDDNIDKNMKTLALAIVSIDGATENVSELVQDLPLTDYLFISKEVVKAADFQTTKS
jgi:hypothetical protein